MQQKTWLALLAVLTFPLNAMADVSFNIDSTPSQVRGTSVRLTGSVTSTNNDLWYRGVNLVGTSTYYGGGLCGTPETGTCPFDTGNVPACSTTKIFSVKATTKTFNGFLWDYIDYFSPNVSITTDSSVILNATAPANPTKGKYHFTGSANFPPTTNTNKGTVRVVITPGNITTTKTCTTEDCSYDLNGFLPSGNYSATLTAQGTACSDTATRNYSFAVDNTPTINLSGPTLGTGIKSKYPEVTGHVTFQENAGCSGQPADVRGKVAVYLDNAWNSDLYGGLEFDVVKQVLANSGHHTVQLQVTPCNESVTTNSTVLSFDTETDTRGDSPRCEDCDGDSGYSVINGNLSQDIPLFDTGYEPLATSFNLYYRSNDQLFLPVGQANSSTYKLPLSQGWTHSYDVYLFTDALTGKMVLRGGKIPKSFYTLSGGVYSAEAGDSSKLVKNANLTYTVTYRDGTKYNFDTKGQLTSIVDRFNNTTTLVRVTKSVNRVLQTVSLTITDPQLRKTVLTYDTANGEKIVQITDPANKVYDLTYDSANLLYQIQAPAVNGTRPTHLFNYSPDRIMTSKVDPNGGTTTYTHDGNFRITSGTDPNGNVRQFSYATGNTTITEKDGGVWNYYVDKTNGVINSKADPSGNVPVAYSYDSSYRIATATRLIDANTTRVSAYQYDAYSNITDYQEHAVVGGVAQPVDVHTTATYDNANYDRILTSTDVIKGLTTTYVYDVDGGYKRTRITDSLGAVTTMHENTNGTVRDVTYPGGATLTYTYTAAGYVSTVTDNHNVKTEFSNFNSSGQAQTVKVYDAGNTLRMTTTLTFDLNGRVATSTVQGTFLTTYGYDYMGNPVSVQDANGNTTSQTVNYKGLPVAITNALGKVTTTGYTATHRPASISDANGNITSFEYNQIGQLTKETPPVGVAVRYTYTPAGLLSQKINNSNNQVIVTYTYGNNGRLTGRSYLDGSSDSFTYTNNRLTSASSSNGSSYTFAYNSNGTLQSLTDANGNVVAYTYDASGRRATTSVNSTHTVTYGYTADRLTEVASNLAGAFGYTYDNLNRRASVSYPNGINGTYSYDATRPGLLAGISYGSVYSVSYPTYDGVGNRTAKNEGSLVTFGYDAVYRLTASSSGEAFTYDDAGNRLTDAGNLYTITTGNTLSSKGSTNYTYDSFGNTLTAGSWTYGWNSKNQLVSAVNGGTTVNFVYDSFGRRVAKTVNGTTTTYVYDGQNIAASITGGVPTHYVQGAGVDEHLAQTSAGVNLFFHADGLGSITKITNSAQTVVGSTTYNSFGTATRTGVATVYGYTGRELDSETGLLYFRARYLNPETGRFLSRDPIGFAGGDVVLNNYVGGNPINFIDPSGLDAIGTLGFGGTIALGVGTYGFGLSGGISVGFSKTGQFVIQGQIYSMDTVYGGFIGMGVQGGGTYSVSDTKSGFDKALLSMKSVGVGCYGGGELQLATDSNSIGLGGGGGRVDGGFGAYYAEGQMYSIQYAVDLRRFLK